MCDIVWISPQSHSSLSVKPHFLWHALQWPWPVRKRFSSDHAVVIMILKDTATFQVLFTVSLFCAWNITTVKINSGVYLLKSQIRQVPLFTSGGLGLGRKNLVLFTSLIITA